MATVTNTVRAVFVDDKDSRITYTGPWTTFDEDFAEYTDYGPTFRGSQHRLLGGTGGLTFTFRGSDRIRIFGTTNARNSSDGTVDPSHTCEVDGITVEPSDPWRWPVNIWPLCGANLTSSGEHTITLNAVSGDTAFYVDMIEYIPDRIIPPLGPTVAINDDDLAVRYLEGAWSFERGTGMLTQDPGAKMSVFFTGSSATWIGGVPIDYPRGASKATYSLDGGDLVEFDVPGLPVGGRTRFNQPFFELRGLSPGEHELIVTYEGPAAPLVFDYLVVENGNIFMTTSPGGGQNETEPGDNEPAGSPTPRPRPSAVGGKKTPVGAIAGGVAGGVIVIALIALLLLWKRNKKKKDRARTESAVVAEYFHSPRERRMPPAPTMYAPAPLPATGQSSPVFTATNITGNSSVQGRPTSNANGPPMAYQGHHSNPSFSAYPYGQPFSSSFDPQQNGNANPLARPTMPVNLQSNRASYPSIPEPMA